MMNPAPAISVFDLLRTSLAARGYDPEALYLSGGTIYYGMRPLLSPGAITAEAAPATLERILRVEFPLVTEPSLTESAQNDRIITAIAVCLVLAAAFVAGWILRGVTI